jgi:hypothetical protein
MPISEPDDVAMIMFCAPSTMGEEVMAGAPVVRMAMGLQLFVTMTAPPGPDTSTLALVLLKTAGDASGMTPLAAMDAPQ